MRKLRYPPGAIGNYLRTAPESIKHLAPLACPMLSKRKPPGREAQMLSRRPLVHMMGWSVPRGYGAAPTESVPVS